MSPGFGQPERGQMQSSGFGTTIHQTGMSQEVLASGAQTKNVGRSRNQNCNTDCHPEKKEVKETCGHSRMSAQAHKEKEGDASARGDSEAHDEEEEGAAYEEEYEEREATEEVEAEEAEEEASRGHEVAEEEMADGGMGADVGYFKGNEDAEGRYLDGDEDPEGGRDGGVGEGMAQGRYPSSGAFVGEGRVSDFRRTVIGTKASEIIAENGFSSRSRSGQQEEHAKTIGDNGAVLCRRMSTDAAAVITGSDESSGGGRENEGREF